MQEVRHLEANRSAVMCREMVYPQVTHQIGNRQKRPHGTSPASQAARAAPQLNQAAAELARLTSGQARDGNFRLSCRFYLACAVDRAYLARFACLAHLVCLACLGCLARHILQWRLEHLERVTSWLESAAVGTRTLLHQLLQTCPNNPKSPKMTQLFLALGQTASRCLSQTCTHLSWAATCLLGLSQKLQLNSPKPLHPEPQETGPPAVETVKGMPAEHPHLDQFPPVSEAPQKIQELVDHPQAMPPARCEAAFGAALQNATLLVSTSQVQAPAQVKAYQVARR